MISIILPSYKSASTLRNQVPGFLSWLKEKQWVYEIIVVDDGSGDEGETEKAAGELGCIFLKNDINLGKGAAVRKGMLAAKGEFRLFTDADVPFDYEAIERFVYYLDFKEFNMVVGDRTLPGSTYFTEISQSRKWGSNVFSFFVGRLVTSGHFDTQCGLKGFRAETAMDIFSVNRIDGFAMDVELLYIALKRNYDIKRLPVTLRCQEGSSVRVLRHGIGMVMDLFRIKWNHVRGRYNRKK